MRTPQVALVLLLLSSSAFAQSLLPSPTNSAPAPPPPPPKAPDLHPKDFTRILHETAEIDRSNRHWRAGAGLLGAALVGGAGAVYVVESESTRQRNLGWSLVGLGGFFGLTSGLQFALSSEVERIDRDVREADGELTPTQQKAMEARFREAASNAAYMRRVSGYSAMGFGLLLGGFAVGGAILTAHDEDSFNPSIAMVGIYSFGLLIHGASTLYMQTPTEAGYFRWRAVAASHQSAQIRLVPTLGGLGVVGTF